VASLNAKGAPAGFPYQVGVSGTTNAGPLIQDVPTSAADLSTADTYLFQVSLTNGTGGALTVTLTDKQTSAKNVMEVTTIGAGTTVAFNWEEGLFCKGGLTWVASGAGIDGAVVAFYRV
jgi:hypothetical protein